MAVVNRRIMLVARPVGYPRLSDFHLVYAPVPAPEAGEVLVRSVYLSLDPDLRARMSETGAGEAPMAIGEVVTGGAVGLVVESRDPEFRIGDAVVGILGWQEYAVAPGRALRRVDPDLAPISTALGVLGLPGLTAYFGLLEVCDPRRGETVVVSGATGGVGMLVGQIAKIRGCRAVGVAGAGAASAWLLDELGFDAVLDFEPAGDSEVALRELCPDGIDVYFDNVGGAVTDAVLHRVNPGARIVVCGQLPRHDVEKPDLGPPWLGQLIDKQAKVEVFQVSAHAQHFPDGREQLAVWLRQGRLKYREVVAQGLEAAPKAFIELLHGRNEGKQLVKLSES
ncbi:MAG: NADP-dependent oxidoreductase [Thermoanaerobaculia bacterium]|nr:NADP-dependent oxidoreductase [Thermoanaerobaculia bacterium]